MLSLRRALFSVVGGFTITDMYVGCASTAAVYCEPSRGPSNFASSLVDRVTTAFISPSQQSLLAPTQHTSLHEDIELAVQKSFLVSTLFVFTVISFGGIWSAVGSCAAILFSAKDGARRYASLKKWMRG